MDCTLTQKHLGSYLDGELSPQQVVDLEAHLHACADCAQVHAFTLQTKRSLRAVLSSPPAPAALHQRVQRSLHGAQARHGGLSERGLSAGLLAVAAVVMLGMFARGNGAYLTSTLGGTTTTAQAGVAAPGIGLFRDVVSGHTDQLPTEVESSEPERVEVWFRGKLGFRVPPVRFEQPEVRLVGARVANVGDRRAARLYYSIGGKRVTAVAFEATPEVRRMLDRSDTLQRAHVGQQEISYHTLHGYTVPVIERGGVVYAFTGDLDQNRLLRLVASAQLP